MPRCSLKSIPAGTLEINRMLEVFIQPIFVLLQDKKQEDE